MPLSSSSSSSAAAAAAPLVSAATIALDSRISVMEMTVDSLLGAMARYLRTTHWFPESTLPANRERLRVLPDHETLNAIASRPCPLAPFLYDYYEHDEEGRRHQLASIVDWRSQVYGFVLLLERRVTATVPTSGYTQWFIEFAGHLDSGTRLPPPATDAPWTFDLVSMHCADQSFGRLATQLFVCQLAAEGKLAPPEPVDPETVMQSGLEDNTKCAVCGSKATETQAHLRGLDEGGNTSIRCTNSACRTVQVLDSR